MTPIKALGYNRVRIIANSTAGVNITFTKLEIPGGTDIAYAQKPNYLSSIMNGRKRLYLSSGMSTTYNIEADDILYLNVIKNYTSSGTVYNASPQDIFFRKRETVEGSLEELINASVERPAMAVPPTPPRFYNIKYSEDGTFSESDVTLTSSMIYGDFYVHLKIDYRIKRIIRVDEGGNMVDYNLVTNTNYTKPNTTLPFGAMDSSSYPTTYGTSYTQPYYGVMLEIMHTDGSPILPTEPILKIFRWKDYRLKSELLTLERFNSLTYTDNTSNIAENVYEKESIRNSLKRAKIGTMADWTALKYIMPTNPSWRSYQYNPNSHQTGIPYSRANVRDRWFGMNTSPTTFVTASLNPYSVLYTERIGDGNTYPFASEYGISEYGSGHGVPYYGYVCSAYVSFVLGFTMPQQTSGFLTDSRMILVKEVGYGATQQALQANELPPLSVITTPEHTYCVLDFLYNEDGVREYAILVESISPNSRATLYRMNRLQTRLDGEYNKYNGQNEKIQLTIPKPSSLYSHKDNNIWWTPYDIDDEVGIIKPTLTYDENIMFYMGDKAVVMKYDTTNYVTLQY